MQTLVEVVMRRRICGQRAWISVSLKQRNEVDGQCNCNSAVLIPGFSPQKSTSSPSLILSVKGSSPKSA